VQGFWAPLLAAALISHPVRFASTNFSTDIAGEADTRPGTWGTAGASEWKITFSPPAGHRVKILRVYGDVVAWAKGKAPAGSYSGLLFGLQTTAPEGSRYADLAADNCFLYLQDVVAAEGKRLPFDVRFDDVTLEPDNVLVVKVAAWLNDTGLPIHIEPTFVLVYRFVPSRE